MNTDVPNVYFPLIHVCLISMEMQDMDTQNWVWFHTWEKLIELGRIFFFKITKVTKLFYPTFCPQVDNQTDTFDSGKLFCIEEES